MHLVVHEAWKQDKMFKITIILQRAKQVTSLRRKSSLKGSRGEALVEGRTTTTQGGPQYLPTAHPLALPPSLQHPPQQLPHPPHLRSMRKAPPSALTSPPLTSWWLATSPSTPSFPHLLTSRNSTPSPRRCPTLCRRATSTLLALTYQHPQVAPSRPLRLLVRARALGM